MEATVFEAKQWEGSGGVVKGAIGWIALFSILQMNLKQGSIRLLFDGDDLSFVGAQGFVEGFASVAAGDGLAADAHGGDVDGVGFFPQVVGFDDFHPGAESQVPVGAVGNFVVHILSSSSAVFSEYRIRFLYPFFGLGAMPKINMR
jgi:hypothetical protein